MKEQLHTIQLTRRELGLIHHIMSIKYTDIDDNVKFGNTSRNQFWHDEYGKDEPELLRETPENTD